jgi:hypothetical protein
VYYHANGKSKWHHHIYELGKIDMHDLIIYLKQTPTFEWHMVRCNFKNGY